MRTVIRTVPGRVELNYMWLPTWLGQNHAMKVKLEKELSAKIVGRELTEDTLDEIDSMVIEIIVKAHPSIPGLFEYLDGLKYVKG